MDVIVPFDATEPKSRLAPLLSAKERREFAEAMLVDVLTVVETQASQVSVLSTEPLEIAGSVTVDSRSLTTAVNAVIAERPLPIAIVMADLPLLTEAAVAEFFAASGDVVAAPGVGGGTNALVINSPQFSVDFHGASFRDHQRVAADRDLEFTTIDSFRLGIDIDEPADLIEVLLHSNGAAREWLIGRGFDVRSEGKRRTSVERSPRD